MRTRLSHAMFVVLAMSSSVIAQTFSLDSAKPFNSAPQQRRVPSADTYGTASEIALAVPDWEFNPDSSATTFASNAGKYLTSAGILSAGIHLPAGASITRMELQACDTSATGSGVLEILEKSNSSGNETSLAFVSVGPNSGCTLTPATLSSPHTVDNAINSYDLQWVQNVADGTPDIKIQAVRVFYKLQVRPPPATATFTDVPTTHLFFQYVEALAAAGITAGCGGGNFCPDAAVTRGQMAVFLSKALGLHWAP